jgi:hypothetical protein
MSDLSINLLLLKEKIMFKSYLIKSNQSPMKNELDTNGAPVFAPSYNATVLAPKMCTNFH